MTKKRDQVQDGRESSTRGRYETRQPQHATTTRGHAWPTALVPIGASALAGLTYLLGRRQTLSSSPQQVTARSFADITHNLSEAAITAMRHAAKRADTATKAAEQAVMRAATTAAARPEARSLPVATMHAQHAARPTILPLGKLSRAGAARREAHMTDKTTNRALTTALEAREAAWDTPSTRDVRSLIKQEVNGQLERALKKHLERQQKTFAQQQKQYETRLSQHEDRVETLLESLRDQLAHVQVDVRPKSRGGFPWMLVLLGGGYYLYRKPELRQQLMAYVDKFRSRTDEARANAGEAAQSSTPNIPDKAPDAIHRAQDHAKPLRNDLMTEQPSTLGPAAQSGAQTSPQTSLPSVPPVQAQPQTGTQVNPMPGITADVNNPNANRVRDDVRGNKNKRR